jgi:carbon-monoxide dehydrogenase medium subunit
LAARLNAGVCEEIRLVVSALAARPKVIGGLDAIALGRTLDAGTIEAVAAAAYRQCRPQISVAYDVDYRHEMVPVFVKRAAREALEGS